MLTDENQNTRPETVGFKVNRPADIDLAKDLTTLLFHYLLKVDETEAPMAPACTLSTILLDVLDCIDEEMKGMEALTFDIRARA